MTRPIFALAALVLAAAPAAAQNTVPANDPAKVPGFDIRWGATREQVNAYWRETPRSEQRERGVAMLAFAPWEGMDWTAMVHEQHGLIGLAASSQAGFAPAMCERVFEAWLGDLRESFAGITPIGGKNVPAGENACTAVREGRGTATFTFANPRTDVVATIWINPQNGLVHYAMGTRAFREWAGIEQQMQAMGASPATPPQAAAPPQAAPAATAQNLGVTDRAMRAIRPGATYAQIVAIIGREGSRASAVQGSGANSETYTWQDGPLKNIGATFMDGRAIMTMQLGLSPQNAGPAVTLAQFEQLREGMTYEEVQRVMGSPGVYGGFTAIVGHVSESYLWRGRTPGSTVSAIFSQGRMTTKMQFGLN